MLEPEQAGVAAGLDADTLPTSMCEELDGDTTARPAETLHLSGGHHMSASAASPDTAHLVSRDVATTHRRLRRLSLTGAVLGTIAVWLSVLPSLIPRPWLMQMVLAGVCLGIAYGLGAFVGWLYRSLGLPVASGQVRAVAWKALAVVAPVGLLVAGWLGRSWQVEQRQDIGMDAGVPWTWVAASFLGVLVALVFLAVGRGLLWVGRKISSWLGRLLPERVAITLAVIATALVSWSIASGVVVEGALTVADTVFDQRDETTDEGVVNPESPLRSGGPQSGVTWEELGRQGRQFIWQGVTAAQIAEVTGDADAMEPIRIYVGLDSAPTADERAQVVIDELRRMGGLERRALAVAASTGSGWIDPKAAAALEYVAHGDVATVSMQYSYLPSWLSFLVDQERAATNGEELITALRVELETIPAEQRPELYVYGESLGAFSTGSAFTGVEDMSTTTDGALLIGPPSFDTTWQRLQANRDAGSPLWQPVYEDGAWVRVARTAEDLLDPALTWETDNRIVYLANATDPIVAWTADRAEWLSEPGPGVPPQTRAMPLVGGLQATVDLASANSTPPEYGHIYDETVAVAWSEILGPPSLPAEELEQIRAAVRVVEDP